MEKSDFNFEEFAKAIDDGKFDVCEQILGKAFDNFDGLSDKSCSELSMNYAMMLLPPATPSEEQKKLYFERFKICRDRALAAKILTDEEADAMNSMEGMLKQGGFI
ncbi:MAG: hypothetical protein LKF31_07845 [Muribaculaceae bacterium]|jgi:hypothetical protein|nr:hypothetical protein [Muribaculaceae bacterium]